ncbi:MAG: alpha/beta hydrolase [Patulibacter minatonensis]
MEFQTHCLQLPGGRRLAYATLGPPDGLPLIYLHGGIGTALTPDPGVVDAVRAHGVLWVAVSRPGFGGSDLHAGRTLESVASDVRALAAAHGWREIGVVGVSSGAPFALACAAFAPELVRGVALAAPVAGRCAPHAAAGLRRRTRWFLRAVVDAPEPTIRVLGAAAWLLRRGAPAITRLADPRRAAAVHAVVAATRAGVRGPVEDFGVCAGAWPAALTQVSAEVHVWHGLQDALVPAEHAWELAGLLPDCRLRLSHDETHFFFRRRSALIAGELADAVRRHAATARPAGRARRLAPSRSSGGTGPW